MTDKERFIETLKNIKGTTITKDEAVLELIKRFDPVLYNEFNTVVENYINGFNSVCVKISSKLEQK